MEALAYDAQGKKLTKKVRLDETVFGGPVNQALLQQVVYVYLSNQRQSNAQAKDRGEVSGGGRKPWRQKGTGRARHGSSRSPIWKGGGVTFGPSAERNWRRSLTKKMRKAAIRSAFAYRAARDEVVVLESLTSNKEVKTKKLAQTLGKISTEPVLLIQQANDKNIINAARNLENVDVQVLNEVNAYLLLTAKKVILIEETLPEISKLWGKAKTEAAKSEVETETKAEAAEKPVKKAKPAAKTVKAKK